MIFASELFGDFLCFFFIMLVMVIGALISLIFRKTPQPSLKFTKQDGHNSLLHITTKDNEYLGYIYCRQNAQYVFCPTSHTMISSTELKEIIDKL